jgi:hypothetical protein
MGREYPSVYQRMCASKVRHPSRHKAYLAVRRVQRRQHPSEAREMHYYRCGMCGGGWHIGHRVTQQRLIFLGMRAA